MQGDVCGTLAFCQVPPESFIIKRDPPAYGMASERQFINISIHPFCRDAERSRYLGSAQPIGEGLRDVECPSGCCNFDNLTAAREGLCFLGCQIIYF